MSYTLAINPSDLEFLPTSESIESVPQIPHEGDYNNSERFENLSRQQLLEEPATDEDSLANEFKERAAEWRRDTKGVSSLTDLFMHPAYQRSRGMGTPALR